MGKREWRFNVTGRYQSGGVLVPVHACCFMQGLAHWGSHGDRQTGTCRLSVGLLSLKGHYVVFGEEIQTLNLNFYNINKRKTNKYLYFTFCFIAIIIYHLTIRCHKFCITFWLQLNENDKNIIRSSQNIGGLLKHYNGLNLKGKLHPKMKTQSLTSHDGKFRSLQNIPGASQSKTAMQHTPKHLK